MKKYYPRNFFKTRSIQFEITSQIHELLCLKSKSSRQNVCTQMTSIIINLIVEQDLK